MSNNSKESISSSKSCSDSRSSYNSGSYSDMLEISDPQEIIEKKLSSIEKLCKKQGKELLSIKESNNFLLKKMEILEKAICNLVKASGIKEDIKENFQAKILDAAEELKKEKGNKEKEINKELPVKKIKKIKPVLLLDDLTNDKILSMAEIQDQRIAIGCEDGSISICSYDLKKNNGKQIFMKKKHMLLYAHFVV